MSKDNIPGEIAVPERLINAAMACFPNDDYHKVTTRQIATKAEANIATILMHNSPEMTKPWTNALEGCIDDGGIPFAKSNGLELFAYMNENNALIYYFHKQ